MSRPEHILRQEGAIKRPEFCTCDDGYWMRNLIDPACHYHGSYAEDLREIITELCDALAMCSHSLKDPEFRQKIVDLFQHARKAIR